MNWVEKAEQARQEMLAANSADPYSHSEYYKARNKMIFALDEIFHDNAYYLAEEVRDLIDDNGESVQYNIRFVLNQVRKVTEDVEEMLEEQ